MKLNVYLVGMKRKNKLDDKKNIDCLEWFRFDSKFKGGVEIFNYCFWRWKLEDIWLG